MKFKKEWTRRAVSQWEIDRCRRSETCSYLKILLQIDQAWLWPTTADLTLGSPKPALLTSGSQNQQVSPPQYLTRERNIWRARERTKEAQGITEENTRMAYRKCYRNTTRPSPLSWSRKFPSCCRWAVANRAVAMAASWRIQSLSDCTQCLSSWLLWLTKLSKVS